MQTNKGKPGFTLIEILIVVGIIVILVTITLVGLLGGRTKAQDNSAFTSFKSIAAPAYMCLTSGAVLTAFNPGAAICSDPLSANGSDWPNFSKYGWDDFYWCAIDAPLGTIPAIGAYNGTTYGGNSTSGDFCFLLKKGADKSMWCSIHGCKKDGF